MRSLSAVLRLTLILLCVAGCSGGGPDVEMIPVTGTVTFSDGSIPQGERAEVNFEPVAGGPNKIRKTAYGEINPADGSFKMTTVLPGDGVIAGKYKVVLTIHKTYMGQESLVAEEYTKPGSTPIEVTIAAGIEPFHWQIEKR